MPAFGSLAQLVEQRTFNPLVAGSNPARPTKFQQKAYEFRFVGFFVSGPYLVALATTSVQLNPSDIKRLRSQQPIELPPFIPLSSIRCRNSWSASARP
jgi:hypothetical protein